MEMEVNCIKEVVSTLEKLVSKPLPKEGERKFHVFTDDGERGFKEIFPGRVLICSDSDAWIVGIRPEGWQGLLRREIGGGGNVTLPWARLPNGEILVGVLMENRPNMGQESAYCIMGGMIDAGESREEAQAREAAEEGGFDTKDANKLPGIGIVSDRLYEVAFVDKGEGVACWEKEYPMSALEEVGENMWRPKVGTINHRKESLTVFIPMREASVKASDSYLAAAILKLAVMLGKI